jgi:putative phage-associated protein
LSTWCPTRDKKEIDIELEKEGEKEKDKINPPILYGEYQNIRLTDEEYQKLQGKLQAHTDTMIEKLSRYIKSLGKDYQDHYVTILNWYEQGKEKLTQKNIQNGSSKTYSTDYEDSDSP